MPGTGVHIEEAAVTQMRDLLGAKLADELKLIDEEFADGIETPKPTDEQIIVGTRRFDPIAHDVLVEVFAEGSKRDPDDTYDGVRLMAENTISVRITNADRQTGDAFKLHQANMRTAAAVVRIADMKHDDLDSPGSGTDANWIRTQRTSREDDYQVCTRVVSFRVRTQELLS